ncbi:helix-turn-helix domain-containing protein [Streptomyces sp. NPDC127084]|uniref:helix-turn-helix domain-containing protein n=1 Tax=Streptomyces sp. NPDC127084 TaxID=3347133 RepID=UPI00364D7CFE
MEQQPIEGDWATRLALSIATEVRRHRQRRKMSAQQLSDRCGELGLPIQRSVLANLESGRRTTINVAEVLVLAAALGVPPGELIFPVGNSPVVEILPGEKREPLAGINWLAGIDSFSGQTSAQATGSLLHARSHEELVGRLNQALAFREIADARMAEVAQYRQAAQDFADAEAQAAAAQSELNRLDDAADGDAERLSELQKELLALGNRLGDLAREAELYRRALSSAHRYHVNATSLEERLRAFRKGIRRVGGIPPLLPSSLSYIEPGAPTLEDIEVVSSRRIEESPGRPDGRRADEVLGSVVEELPSEVGSALEGLLSERFADLVADAVVQKLERGGAIAEGGSPES